jgi:hypothetical protein
MPLQTRANMLSYILPGGSYTSLYDGDRKDLLHRIDHYEF